MQILEQVVELEADNRMLGLLQVVVLEAELEADNHKPGLLQAVVLEADSRMLGFQKRVFHTDSQGHVAVVQVDDHMERRFLEVDDCMVMHSQVAAEEQERLAAAVEVIQERLVASVEVRQV